MGYRPHTPLGSVQSGNRQLFPHTGRCKALTKLQGQQKIYPKMANEAEEE